MVSRERAHFENALKILVYSHYFLPSVGGVERLVASMAWRFAERGHQVCVATVTAPGAFEDTTLPYRVVRKPSATMLGRLIRGHDVTHLAGPALIPMLLGYLLRKPFVVEHHMYQAICPNGLLVYQPDQTVCPGHFMAGRHRNCLRCNAGSGGWTSLRMWLTGFPRLWLCRRAATNISITGHVDGRLRLPRSRRIYHGVSATELAPTSSATAADQNGTACFAYIGRFVREKGLLLLVQAAASLKRDGYPFRLKFIGDGPERKNLEAAVTSQELLDRSSFTGMLAPDDLQRETTDVTALVMPSVWEETAGLAAMEQMMRGKALIVSEIGGLAEVAGDVALKFPPGNVQALADCMRQFIEKPELIRELGHHARVRAEHHFEQDRMIIEHLRLYETLLK